MYLRTREDALDALAVILQLPDRPSQIIEVTMRIALCLDSEARNFLVDCQAALIQGGLEALRKRRRESLASLAKMYEPPELEPLETFIITEGEEEAPAPAPAPPPPPKPEPEPEPEVFILVDGEVKEAPPPAEPAPAKPLTPDQLLDPLLEEVGTALDLLKVVDIAQQVFPRLREERQKWEIARHIFKNEEKVRETIVAGMRERQNEKVISELQDQIIAEMDSNKPWWGDWVGSLRETCRNSVLTMKRFRKAHPVANDHELLFNVIAMSEERARELLDTVTKSPADAVAYVSEIRTRVDWIESAEEKSRS